MVKRFVTGSWVDCEPKSSNMVFPESNVEPDDAYTIREIYDCWRKGKPTSVHPFNVVFDEEGNDFDDSDASDDFMENPIDSTEVLNGYSDASEQLQFETDMIREAKRRKKKEIEQSVKQSAEVKES